MFESLFFRNSKPTILFYVIVTLALKTCRKQWTIEKGGVKGSGISVLMVQHDDDDDGFCHREPAGNFIYLREPFATDRMHQKVNFSAD